MSALPIARAATPLERPALSGAREMLSAAALTLRVERLAAALQAARPRPRVLGLIADNGPDWVLVDLAAERIGLPLVPLPAFFTLDQMRHAAQATGVDALLCEWPATAHGLGFARATALEGTALPWFRRSADPVELPAGTAKITFTSGTTGTPKGVCLSASQQHAVATALTQATRELGIERHLALLPLPVLLENIAGVHAPLLADATCCVAPLAEVGVAGAARFDARACLAAIGRWQANSVILLPQMMVALTAALEAGAPRPTQLRFAAVGGAKVAPGLIERARAAGLPAYEGYGLSECGSVVALNVPGADKPGSVGRPLSHVDVRIDDGEITVERSGFLGYVGQRASEEPLRTGDLGHIDAEGFLHVDGRCKHQLITSFGRNIAPEWPEAELAVEPAILQAAVFGEARPWLCAVIVPRTPDVTDAALKAAVGAANHRLPDYARIAYWIRAFAPFSVASGLATANGRIRRDAIWARYRKRLEYLYDTRAGADALL